jgi:hypothetical protein
MRTKKNFDVPVYEYYSNGGKYSGCRRSDNGSDFNYKIEIVKTEESSNFTIYIWYGIYSFECSKEVSHESFDNNTDGLSAAYDYIDEAFEVWEKILT